jgi:hypothetical protein
LWLPAFFLYIMYLFSCVFQLNYCYLLGHSFASWNWYLVLPKFQHLINAYKTELLAGSHSNGYAFFSHNRFKLPVTDCSRFHCLYLLIQTCWQVPRLPCLTRLWTRLLMLSWRFAKHVRLSVNVTPRSRYLGPNKINAVIAQFQFFSINTTDYLIVFAVY